GTNRIRVSEFAPGRTFSATGIDKFLNLGAGVGFDSRDYRYYASRGLYINTTYTRYGFIDKAINFGKFSFESQTYIPFYFNKKYYITLASRLYTAFAIGADIPIYKHEYLGYSDNYVRGWSGKAYEGEDEITIYNELRIPIYKPRYINGSKVPLIKSLPFLKNLDLLHGLYFAVIYDIGTVFDNADTIS